MPLSLHLPISGYTACYLPTTQAKPLHFTRVSPALHARCMSVTYPVPFGLPPSMTNVRPGRLACDSEPPCKAVNSVLSVFTLGCDNLNRRFHFSSESLSLIGLNVIGPSSQCGGMSRSHVGIALLVP